MTYLSANRPEQNGMMAHIQARHGDIAPIVLLPGNPSRVDLTGSLCDYFSIVTHDREYRLGTGTFCDTPVSVCSTGIGGPSTEIAVLELIALGAKVLIRMGGTGALLPHIQCGDMIINTAAMRLGGASQFYAPPEYPAVASWEVVSVLVETCQEEGFPSHCGISASVGSFFRGQGRTPPAQADNGEANILEPYRRLGITNMEMESETIFTLASLYGVFSGSICTAHCNRISDLWLDDNEDAQKNLCSIALESAKKLYHRYQKEWNVQ